MAAQLAVRELRGQPDRGRPSACLHSVVTGPSGARATRGRLHCTTSVACSNVGGATTHILKFSTVIPNPTEAMTCTAIPHGVDSGCLLENTAIS